MHRNQGEISWDQLLAGLMRRADGVDVAGMTDAAAPWAIAQMYRTHRAPLLVVAATAREAEQCIEILARFLTDLAPPLLLFPPYHASAFKSLAYHNETAGKRIRTLFQMVEGVQAPLVVTTAGALLQRLIPKAVLTGYAELLAKGEEIDRDALVQKLVDGGYSRAALVEEMGDFGVRGGILDIFTPMHDDPLRIELDGDLVASIRSFDPDTQRTIRDLDEVVILPAREAVLDRGTLNAVLGRIRTRAAELGLPVTAVRDIVQRFKTEGLFPGLEGLLPLIFDQLDTLFDYLAPDTVPILLDPVDLARSAAETANQSQQGYESAKARQQLVVAPDALYLGWDRVGALLDRFKPVTFIALAVTAGRGAAETILCRTKVSDTDDLRRRLQAGVAGEQPLQPLVDWLQVQSAAGLTVLLMCRRPSHRNRLAEGLAAYGLQANLIEAPCDMLTGRRRIYLLPGGATAGFVWPDAGIALLSDEEIFGTAYRPRKTIARPAAADQLLNIEDLKSGDLVVHSEHGIGRYEGLVKLAVDRSVNDYLLLVYRDGDKLYLPVERMGLVQKYMGVDEVAPVLDKMGGVTWERVKDKVKRSTEKIAGELLKLYAERKVQKGHAFGEVDTYFRDFEEGFPYEETADQRKTIEDVLNDMRQPMPMDRLVCGDVGYGKTEVGLRAAFLAVSDAKQVAVLVPTTVLAEQHYATFSQRFKRYPVRVASLSRFRSAKEQRQIVEGIREGTIDIVIGTHRLLQKDVVFKSLGLLILDEEQRFGVRHKEKIKSLRASVDVLTLTATPIPRTLHFSLLGLRDISLIATPPEQRRAIVTYVCEFDEALVADAIRKELARDGQIFFVHNHIAGLERLADHLQRLVPEVRLAVAHGRMPEDQLEKVMLDFMQHRIQMLVCTTIIESGLDVSGANTIFINRADYFGLAQIYQLRGRVGRGDEQAYAYLFIPPETTLTKDAQKRLKVLMEHSDLGSGFQIAMSDLKIRGGGTILGASQSGHIAAVGYDMFLRLMESSIAELKGEPVQESLEPEINLPLAAFLPEHYIADIDQRLSIYRRLARMTEVKAVSALKAEMEDRFGRLPDEAGNLLLKIMLKILAVRAGCKRLDLQDHHLQLQFSELHQQKPFGIVEMVAAAGQQYRITPDHIFKATLSPGPPKALVARTKNLLIEIARHVNE
ncbi:transcription-repair coupling factor [Desulfatitalea alkaliphila]|uniref:Transcription-repair-coupling factor n=1 Tax=Desulfatitalea alkaliphila TaxID=2929485 RepID=A0AA41R6F4_9BACT|nr:transcription-repair coupling factor [Desulfatitalea alkaliphila]MCJ8499973.1 transcription-repair coupling factor [Desulfatitalea alkaliphila]